MSLLDVRNLRISTRGRQIVTGVDLELERGEALGIVGESGSGKSLTARSIVGILPPGVRATGSIVYGGRDLVGLSAREMGRIRGREVAMIFQDPFTMLNPLMRCGAQIVELLRDDRGHRLDRRAGRREACRRLDEVGIEDAAVADAYPFELSGGMRQRVGIAAALALDPQILIADEPSTALDAITQREVLARLRELQVSRQMSLILITHDLRVAFSMCDRICVLYAGSVLESAPAAQLEAHPRHPYTVGLLLSEPPADRRVANLPAIPGSVPDPADVADSCPFAPRCAWVKDTCRSSAPPLLPVGSDHVVACVRQEAISSDLNELASEAHAPVEDPGPLGDDLQCLAVVDGVSKTFGNTRSGRTVRALNQVSIEISAGEKIGLVGESGSGKSTLGRMLVGLEDPDCGRIAIDGVDLTAMEALDPARRRALRRQVQMVFQDPYSTLNPARTVGATLEEAASAGGGATVDRKRLIHDLLIRVGLPADYARRRPAALSGGERQRVAVARALATNPRLIVCDEAVSALDVSVQAQIVNLLLSVHQDTGISLLFITHDLAVVRQVADRLYVLCDGVVVEQGATVEVLDRPQHRYTQALLAAVPRADDAWLRRERNPSVEAARA